MTEMHLLSVNVGLERPIENAGKTGKTGIFKNPVAGAVRVTRHGVAGDTISDTENHGGVDQAVYVFGGPDYAWWTEELGRELPPGTFGENLTVSGLESGGACIGDRLRVGAAVLEVTAPRIPCATLAARMGDPLFVKRFRRAERPGLYCRVLSEGRVRAGDPVELEPYEGEKVFALEIFRDFFDPYLDEATLRRHLAVPIAIRARVDDERKLRLALSRRDVAAVEHREAL
ncbi:MAG: MOSC domain-containing protein [Actinomycetota bacterium]|nr:MOSC domain-containing protein [Actinomycetota bacterium]